MRWTVLLAVICAGGCGLEDNLVACPGDVLCPAGSVCDTVHGGCVSPEQASACIGVADREPCTTDTVVGYCLDQICIDPGCGNHVVDDGELCDDGNRDDADGCSATCFSREACGDSALDRRLGEACDDGNLQSHDGCDSRCLQETAVWTVDEIGPSQAEPDRMVFDSNRGRTVTIANGYVWGWDGTRWSVLATDAPDPNSDYDVVFDSVRDRLVMIAASPPSDDFLLIDPPRTLLYEWDGSTWTSSVTTNAPETSALSAVYDTVRQRVFVFGANTAGPIAATLDLVTKTWSPVTAPQVSIGYLGFDAAFDVARGKVVVVVAASGGSPSLHEWNGSSWTSLTPAMATSAGWSLLYDPSVSRVIAAGGSSVQSWNGSSWNDLMSLPQVVYAPALAFDTVRGVRVVFGGAPDGPSDDVIEGAGTTWTKVARTTPPPSVTVEACGFDDERQRFACVGRVGNLNTETWTWNGTWTSLGGASPADPPTAIAYDPVRRLLVAVAFDSAFELTDSGWREQALVPAINDRVGALVFAPDRQQLVGIARSDYSGETYGVRLAPDNTVTQFPSTFYDSLAYDARNQHVVGVNGLGRTEALVGDTWTPIVGPGLGFTAVTSPRRGTVEFVAAGRAGVERIGSLWVDLTALPPHVIRGPSAYNPSTGELHIIGINGISRFMLHRRWESATPFEQCAGSEDLDGDSLAGCDDPDCWTSCSPVCPPLTTCP